MTVCDPSPADGQTIDPEYNLRKLHSTSAEDNWWTQEEPADNTYRPHEELTQHDYQPQDLTQTIVPETNSTRSITKDPEIPAFLPGVNTTSTDPWYPQQEYTHPASNEFGHTMHIMTYGTIEDVAFADRKRTTFDEYGEEIETEDDAQRRNGLVLLSVRDEYDDLIHLQFHTLNPLSLLNEENVAVGDRVRIDIQDYKNVIEWFIFNYPMELYQLDSGRGRNDGLTVFHECDGAWFYDDMQNTLQGDPNPMYGKNCMGGSITMEPNVHNPTPNHVGKGEDWEHEPPSPGYSQFYRSFLEIGQMDGNKKLTLMEFLNLLRDYFHIDDIWKHLRDHEKRIVHLERDVRKEDGVRNRRVTKLLTMDDLLPLPMTQWPRTTSLRGEIVFVGNAENRQFTLNIDFRDSCHCPDQQSPFRQYHEVKGGRNATRITLTPIPEEFWPSKFQWIRNYALATVQPGAWEYVLMDIMPVSLGIDVDGSIWVCTDEMPYFSFNGSAIHLGIMGHDPAHITYASGVGLDMQYRISSFGGIIDMGDARDGGDAW